MSPEIRAKYHITRNTHFNDILRTTLFGQLGIAALIGFGAEGITLLLVVLTIAITVFGIAAGNAALDDINKLRDDMDEATSETAYAKQSMSRNLEMLKMLSTGFLAIIGVTELLAILFS